jgi:hypothetical protein
VAAGLIMALSLTLIQASRIASLLTRHFIIMNENGYYTGWTEHKIKIKPSLAYGFTLSIAGRNLNDIKQYIGETFEASLNQEIDVRTEENI